MPSSWRRVLMRNVCVAGGRAGDYPWTVSAAPTVRSHLHITEVWATRQHQRRRHGSAQEAPKRRAFSTLPKLLWRPRPGAIPALTTITPFKDQRYADITNNFQIYTVLMDYEKDLQQVNRTGLNTKWILESLSCDEYTRECH